MQLTDLTRDTIGPLYAFLLQMNESRYFDKKIAPSSERSRTVPIHFLRQLKLVKESLLRPDPVPREEKHAEDLETAIAETQAQIAIVEEKIAASAVDSEKAVPRKQRMPFCI